MHVQADGRGSQGRLDFKGGGGITLTDI